MEKFCNIVRTTTEKLVIPAAIAMMCIVLIIVIKVITRKIGVSIIPGSVELIEMLVVILTTMSITYAMAMGNVIVLDIVTSHLSKLGQFICKICGYILGLIFWALMVWGAVWYIAGQFGMGVEKTTILGVPYLPFRILWLLCMLIYLLIIFIDFRQLFKSGVR